MNIYDGCESNKEIIYGSTSLDFYDKLEKRQNEILSQGKKVVGYCDCCGMYAELICLSNKGRTCENCTDWDF